MKKILSAILLFIMIVTFSACENGASVSQTTESGTEKEQPTTSAEPTTISLESSDLMNTTQANKILIAYFSRADENYGVGVIEKGNTQIIAEMIADETGGDLFHIERDTPYPANYDECTNEAKSEQNSNARPALKEDIDIAEYDVIFLGYPNWWGDMPMPVYTFLEAHGFSGKTVIPFCTHAGSGLSSTECSIQNTTGATLLDGLAIYGTTAQNEQDEARKSVREWLGKLSLSE